MAPAALAVNEVERPLPDAPSLAAVSYLLIDYHSGRVLVENNVDKRVEPASLTKMMTSYIVSDELKKGTYSLEDRVTVSERAWRMGGSKMFIEVGEQVSVLNLLRGLIVQSGNDAAVALAEYTAGSESSFADLMNSYAQHLGLAATHYENATGMPSAQHYTTARDLGRLAISLIRDFPEDYQFYSEKEFTYNEITQRNRNELLWSDPSVDGLKTGHTESAGYCLVATAERDGMRLISVVMGTKGKRQRKAETQKLLTYGFRFFEGRKLFAENQELQTLRVWMGESTDLPIGLDEDLYITVPRGNKDELRSRAELQANLTAPITAGQQVGILKIMQGEDIVSEKPLVALQTVAEGGWLEKSRDTLLQMWPW